MAVAGFAPSPTERPIVCGSFPASGHTYPLIQVAAHLVGHGFPVFFIAAPEFESPIKAAGAEYIKNDYTVFRPGAWEGQHEHQGADQLIYHLKYFFVEAIEPSYTLVVQCLEDVREKHPGREVIILEEIFWGGAVPFFYGAPAPKGYDKVPTILGLHTSINCMNSVDLPPFGPGLPLPTSEEERARYQAMVQELFVSRQDRVSDHANAILARIGATSKMDGWYMDITHSKPKVTMLSFSPSLDYPRSDLSPNTRFVGGLPLKPLDSDFKYPPWWGEVQDNAALPADSPSKKKLVFVTQGTVAFDYASLLLPTIEAFASRDDVLVIATLGKRGESLPADTPVPANTKVIDYLPYDALLPYTDVFVSNAGFGGYMHSIMNGVPMVLGGAIADKAEVCARAAWSGVGVNLATEQPSAQAIADGVAKVLGDPSYKKRALELKKENEDMDALGSVEKIIMEHAK
ncbi:UDP-Glycosyltransferase/glycogen phosphorylase [Thozetella sp. PMI_491]|nr:UDP-Glycosyltransferase/glycogen phosphorylase [Thozetella sp. PMI_491]